MWFFINFVGEKSHLLTDPRDVSLTDNQCSTHDKFYHYMTKLTGPHPVAKCLNWKIGKETED